MKAIVDAEGGELELNIPMAAEEIEYRQFCDFQAEDIEFLEANQAEDRKEPAIAMHLKNAVKAICGPATDHVPFGLGGDSITRLVQEKYRVKIGDDISVLRLYAHLCTVLKEANYVGDMTVENIPLFLDITHGGQKYRVIGNNAVRVMDDRPVRTAEFVECMEYKRLGAKSMKGRTKGEISSLHYTVAISQFAILVKQQGEELPEEEGARERWIKERRELLADLPLTDVMKVRFFLTATLSKSRNPASTVSFGKVRQEGKAERLVKAVKRNGRSVIRKIGRRKRGK